jgi:hypothetical protein
VSYRNDEDTLRLVTNKTKSCNKIHYTIKQITMKKILLILSAVLVFTQMQAQNAWTQKADFGGTARRLQQVSALAAKAISVRGLVAFLKTISGSMTLLLMPGRKKQTLAVQPGFTQQVSALAAKAISVGGCIWPRVLKETSGSMTLLLMPDAKRQTLAVQPGVWANRFPALAAKAISVPGVLMAAVEKDFLGV